ncbi:MAG: hypothetical protein LBU97_05500, partial [Alistipes sp.]|nr:hypothetical protein [Alistipes sp.]
MRSKSFTIAIALLAAGGCVREIPGDCDGAVIVAVRDKNYDNAAEVGDTVVDEHLPMLSYITGLVTQNHPRGTNRYTPFVEGLTPIELIHPLPPERLAGGVNELTVVGDAPESAMLYGEAEASRILTLHPHAAPGDDFRLGGDAVAYPRADD